jgi:DNA repair exonuclease SbcCD nuclease subunit
MRFIQTSDLHIGHCRTLDGYLERHAGILEQIARKAQELSMPLIVAGDIFHSKTTRHEERILAFNWLCDLEQKEVPTIIIAGNHDHLDGEATQLAGLDRMPFRFIRIAAWHPKVVKLGGAAFICIPWRKYTKEALEKVVRQYLPSLEGCRYRVAVLHECIAGVKLDSGRIMPSGTALPDIPEITYWAVGDIHNHQRANLGNSWYSGAPAQLQFGDGLSKGVIIPDLERPSAKPDFLPIASKPLKVIGSVDEISGDAYYKVEGSFEEVLRANGNEAVVSSELSCAEAAADFERSGIADGLAEFLASKGLGEKEQKRAVKWTESLFREERVA